MLAQQIARVNRRLPYALRQALLARAYCTASTQALNWSRIGLCVVLALRPSPPTLPFLPLLVGYDSTIFGFDGFQAVRRFRPGAV